ncbi:MAG: hypothetical protein RL679_522 [Bacteroidota bacterium]|jgi:hypothetical protein
MELDLRVQSFTLILTGILATSLLLLILARIRNSKAIPTVLSSFLKNSSIDQHFKENMRMESLSSIFLLLNYFVCFSVCLFLFFSRMLSLDLVWAIGLSIFIPIGLFVLDTLSIILVGAITGESKKLQSSLIITLSLNQFFGLFLSLVSLLWIMNPEFNAIYVVVFGILLVLHYLMRVLKNTLAILINGVSWYYLILYFCTLEILPLYSAYYYVASNFAR